ncbi:UNVERIFIED_CONTAM: hypothetical protein HHA_240940 [Hammondia hammondi]|eukprot:XP_008887814.1 hypothetical protein HHA_240940 [Hammondia hammondi]
MPGRTQRSVVTLHTTPHGTSTFRPRTSAPAVVCTRKRVGFFFDQKDGSGRGCEVDETRKEPGGGGDRRHGASRGGRPRWRGQKAERKDADWKRGNWGDEGKQERSDCRGTAKQKWTKNQTEQPLACAEQSDRLASGERKLL